MANLSIPPGNNQAGVAAEGASQVAVSTSEGENAALAALAPSKMLVVAMKGHGSFSSGVQPKHLVKDLVKPITTDFCSEELRQHVNISLVTTDARLTAMTDEEISVQPLQAGTEYRGLTDAVALFSSVPVYPWDKTYDENTEQNIVENYIYVPLLFASCELVPNRTLDWEKGIEDGEILVNDQQLLVYAGVVKDWQPSTNYRGGDRVLIDLSPEEKVLLTEDPAAELYTFKLAKTSGISSSEEGASAETDELFQFFDEFNDNTIVVSLWDEVNDQGSLKIFNPENLKTSPGNLILGPFYELKRKSHCILKEVNGIKTLWQANWHHIQTVSYNEIPNIFVDNEEIPVWVMLENVLWRREFLGNSATLAPPFRLSIPDGASIRYVGHESYSIYRYYGEIIFLRRSLDGDEDVDALGLTGDGGQTISIFWNRRHCCWVYENT